MGIWQEDNLEFYQDLYNQIDVFFEQLHSCKELEYRVGQHTMALDVLDAIREKEMLLIEAGVGSGKSWGYLVPLLYASKNKEKFKGFIISTSSIALQEQLEQEINKISELLGINIDVTIAKGKANFICEERLKRFLNYKDNNEHYKSIKERLNKGEVDRRYFDDIQQEVWRRINVDKINCLNCFSKKDCKYILKRKQWVTSTAIICNHDLLVESLKRDTEDRLMFTPSILVVDEAHMLEEKIRNSYQQSLSKHRIESLIYNICNYIEEPIEGETEILNTINQVFRKISTKAKQEYRKNATKEVEILDSKTSGFTCTPIITEEIKKIVQELAAIEKIALDYPMRNSRFVDLITELQEVKKLFADLISKNSKNIYWAEFLPHTNEYIELQCVKKDITQDSARLLGNLKYGKVFTSATMTTKKDNYKYFSEGLGIDKILGISKVDEEPQPSPYNYDQNTLLYYAQDVVSPKSKDHELYLDSLAKKISELAVTTNGKSLVLFTSKTDMNAIYDRLKKCEFPFKIFVQEDGKNADIIKEKFKNDINSTLLATGSFWEGIDIRGESLEQVIITKLPFPVVNPVIQQKASQYTNGFEKVYIPEMLLKLKQGTGRLIRSATDKGIISILDSRAGEYIEILTENLPFSNMTTDMEEVKEFVDKNLNNDDKKSQKRLIK